MEKPSIVFITGNAGTGKTTFLKYITQDNEDMTIDTDNIDFVEAVNSIREGEKIVVAPTGVAAINAGGSTINSFFQINPYKKYPEKFDVFSEFKYRREKKEIIRDISVLIIDEISMVKCEVLDLLNTILKAFRGKYDLPFGGVQLVVIGDLFQLPPIKDKQSNPIYKTEYFFSAKVFHECFFADKVKFIELKKIYRQKSDTFINILNNIRDGSVTDEQMSDLNARCLTPESDDGFITITTHNANASELNTSKYNLIQADEKRYDADIDGEFKDEFFKAIKVVTLKVGAQVMVIKNNNKRGYYNGMIGTVTHLNENNVMINVKGINHRIEFEKWEKFEPRSYGGKVEMEVVATFTQMPLKLAWAITIHKAQGLTFERAVLDVESSFESGQVYVALSRCTSLEGLYLKSRIPKNVIKIDKDVVSFTKYVRDREAYNKSLTPVICTNPTN